MANARLAIIVGQHGFLGANHHADLRGHPAVLFCIKWGSWARRLARRDLLRRMK